MTIQNIPLFQALGGKLNFLNAQQQITANNIANSDTPGFRPREVRNVDFGRVLNDVANTGGIPKVRVASTQPGHLPAAGQLEDIRDRRDRVTYEVAPAENAVVIEEQVLKAGQTAADFRLTVNLLGKNVGLIRTALGRNQ